MSVDFSDTTNTHLLISSQFQEDSSRISRTTSEPQFGTESEGNHGVLSTSNSRTNLATKKHPSYKRRPRNNHASVREYEDYRFEGEFSGNPTRFWKASRPQNDLRYLENDNPSTDQPKPGKVCRFYYKYGFCKFGSHCLFIHSEISSGPERGNFNKDLTPEKSVDNCTDEFKQKFPFDSKNKDGQGSFRPNRGQEHRKTALSDSYSQKNSTQFQDAFGAGFNGNFDEQDDVNGITIDNLSSKVLAKHEKEKITAKIRPCWYFKNYGSCRYADRCRYDHLPKVCLETPQVSSSPKVCNDISGSGNSDDQKKYQVEKTDDVYIDEPDELDPANKVLPKQAKDKKKVKTRPCWQFKQYGTCRYGDNCRYKHSSKVSLDKPLIASSSKPCRDVDNDQTIMITAEDDLKNKEVQFENFTLISENPLCEQEVKFPQVPQKSFEKLKGLQVHKLEELTNEDLKSLRQTEVSQLKKRFPRCQVLQDDISCSEFLIEFVPSDPDWPFEVKSLQLKVLFPSEYPVEPCIVEIVDTEDRFPEILIRFLDQSIEGWLKNRHEETLAAKKVEIVFKSFLRWLDRNLEDLFINGLKKVKKEKEAKDAGIEFIPFENLQFTPSSQDLLQTEESESPKDAPNKLEEFLLPEPKPKETNALASTAKRGTEIVLRSMEFGENAATVVCRKIAVTLQCGRCKNRNDIECPANRANKIFCTRCHHTQTLTFRPQMMHQFGCILGYLDLSGCQVVDLPIVNCNFDICCLNCSKTMAYDGLHYGQRSNIWCSYCNSKMTIFVDSVKFQHLQPSTTKDGKLHLMKLETKEKHVKDPAIQEGKPLPNDGTCKHYKKSYRWLRFPCCGKAYPCDKCHAENETDHEMKYATRMICGFCAKEQLYASERDCVLCKSSMTRKSSSHWEGGKGCRDKLTMSRDDQHKYSGINKTVSRKVQEKTKPPQK